MIDANPPANGRSRKASRQNAAQRNTAAVSRRVSGLARKQLDLFISLEPKVLRGNDPDAVHDIRVASRRLQQILELMYPKPRPAKLRKLRRTIRRSRRALSNLRNCDVLLERVEKALERKQLAQRNVWEAFRDYLREEREFSSRKGLRRLSNLNLPSFYVNLKEFLQPDSGPHHAEPVSNGGTAGRAASVSARLADSLQETWSDLAARVEQSREDSSPAVLHAVRIAAKRVRYLIEVIHDLGEPGSEQALACLKQLQEHLGDWHDLEVMEEMMLGMLSRPKFLRQQLELAIETGRLVLRNRRGKHAYEKRFFEMVRDSREWGELEAWVAEFLAKPQQTEAGAARS